MTTHTLTLKPSCLGSVSTATLRTEDLLSAFLHELEWQTRSNGDYYSLPENRAERDKLANLVGEAQDCFTEDGEGIDADKLDLADELVNETLPDALTIFAPPYCYFGAHPGDGADFGYWPDTEAIDELPCVEDSDAARALGEDCKSVNDHGNVTVYGGNGAVLLELV